MALLQKFNQELKGMGITTDTKILVAVSGGIDSMVMLDLMQQSQRNIIVAHCNFNLRGDAADADELLVRSTAEKRSVKCHVKSFDTTAYSLEKGISIQMAARELRYHWFKELALSENCTAIATAHHANDSAETMLLNLIKGTGLAGMHGIPAASGQIIRPLIRCYRDEIMAYAQSNQVMWREDCSNDDIHYERNFIRHEVLPILRGINARADDALIRHAAIIERYELILGHHFRTIASTCCETHHHGVFQTIDWVALKEFPEPATILYHLIREHGFNYQQCEALLHEETSSGAFFRHNDIKIIKDRQRLVLQMTSAIEDAGYLAKDFNQHVDTHFGTFHFSSAEAVGSDFGNPNVAYLYSESWTFPLEIRPIKPGDRFHPLGMKHSKLVSDFFTDAKTGYMERTTAYVICMGEEILWLAPFRISERFKITYQNSQLLRVEWRPKS